MIDMDDDPQDQEVPTCVDKQTTGCDDNNRLVIWQLDVFKRRLDQAVSSESVTLGFYD